MNDYMQKLDKAVDEMFERLSLRFPADDMIRLRQAYTLAKEAHEGQKRAAGDPYIMHPVAVARIVAEAFMLDVLLEELLQSLIAIGTSETKGQIFELSA